MLLIQYFTPAALPQRRSLFCNGTLLRQISFHSCARSEHIEGHALLFYFLSHMSTWINMSTCALSLLWPVRSLKIVTCAGLSSRWKSRLLGLCLHSDLLSMQLMVLLSSSHLVSCFANLSTFSLLISIANYIPVWSQLLQFARERYSGFLVQTWYQ